MRCLWSNSEDALYRLTRQHGADRALAVRKHYALHWESRMWRLRKSGAIGPAAASQRRMGKGDVGRGLKYQARGHWLKLLVSKGAVGASWMLWSLCDISGRHTNLSEELHLCESHENRMQMERRLEVADKTLIDLGEFPLSFIPSIWLGCAF